MCIYLFALLQFSDQFLPLKNKEYMVGAEMEKVYPVSEKAYLGKLKRAKICFLTHQINLPHLDTNYVFDLSCFYNKISLKTPLTRIWTASGYQCVSLTTTLQHDMPVK